MDLLSAGKDVFDESISLKLLNDYKAIPINVEKILEYSNYNTWLNNCSRFRLIHLDCSFNQLNRIDCIEMFCNNRKNIACINADLIAVGDIPFRLDRQDFTGFMEEISAVKHRYLLLQIPYQVLKWFSYVIDNSKQMDSLDKDSKLREFFKYIFPDYKLTQSLFGYGITVKETTAVKRNLISLWNFSANKLNYTKDPDESKKINKVKKITNFSKFVNVYCNLRYSLPTQVVVLLERNGRSDSHV